MNARTGRDVVLEILRSEGVRHVFGNPGSTELPLIDALAGAPDLQYVLALQEASVVAMADGYAQATRRPAFLNLHTSAGVGNAIGNLTNAVANGTPLVVTAGQQDYRHIVSDPLLSGDLVGLARPVAKWSHEVRTLGELGTVLRRAFSDATAVPTGPVFVSLPMNILEEEGEAPIPRRSTIDARQVAGSLEELADLLAGPPAGNVAIVAGDEVARSGAIDALVELAEALGAPVHGSPIHANTVFPPSHPLWAGALEPKASSIRQTLGRYQRVLLVGGQAFVVYPFTPGPALPDDVELLHLSPDAHQLGRTYATRLGVSGDPRATLQALLPLVRARADADAVARRLEEATTNRESDMADIDESAAAKYTASPMHPVAAVHALLRALSDDVVVVEEAPTTGKHVRSLHRPTAGGRYFFPRGGGLGWGMPAAVGVSLGYGGAPVLCIVGDGSAMYSPQALWTAAHEELPVVFAVINNRQYLILKNNLRKMEGTASRSGNFVAMDIVNPAVDFVALAASMGVAGQSVEKTVDVADAVAAAMDRGGPYLLELPVSAP